MSEIKDIPKHWEIKKLREVCKELQSGKRPKGGVQGIESGIPSLGAEHLNFNGGFKFQKIKFVPKEFAVQMKKGIVCKNDIIVVKDGATTGKTSFVGTDFPFDFAVINEHVFIVRLKDEVLPKYVFYKLFSSTGHKEILEDFRGAAQGGISSGFLDKVTIPFPSIPEQQAIVAKIEELLSELENGKQQLLTAQQQLKVYRQSLLKWAFEGKLTNKNVKEGELPKGWKWVIINDIGKIKGGKRLPPKHQYSEEPTEYAYIMAGNLKDGTVKNKTTYIKEETYNALSNYKVIGGEVYVTIVGACIGDAGVIPQNIGKSILTENAAKIVELKNVHNKYLSRWINSHNCQLQIKRKILSATLGKLALNRIGTIEVPIPLLDEQQLIIDELESKFTVCDKIEETISQSLQQAEILRQSILKKAFEGKLVKIK
ncbi:MAG: restriction endonuclease subunit S [Bacteroidetes bacterium]|nr:restriction endonuclease subunit S [Bacteroidota bacterium]